MPLDPQFQALRDRRARSGEPPLYALSVAQARAADLAAIQADGGSPRALHQVIHRTIPGPGSTLPIRVYRPGPDRQLPVLLYYFGGGWTLGGLDTSDVLCRTLAAEAGCLVVSVGYRLAPEHPFPAAVHDCHAGLRWVAAHAHELGADPARLAVGGDSAGGNLAAAVSLLARDDGGLPLAGQLLVYPNTDQLADDASLRENADPTLFNHHSVAWYARHYLRDPADAADPLASPLRAPDLTGLPPALVITAEFDPLRDQGEAYAHRLAAAGVPVELTRYPGMAHGFFAMGGTIDAATEATDQAARQLRRWFALSPDPGTSLGGLAAAEPVAGTVLGGARMTDRIVVPFEGPGGGVGELTWGQRKVWTLMELAGGSMSMGGAVPVTDGRTERDLASELRFFMSRYASMRARIRPGADGRLIQEVSGEGRAVLGIVDTGDDPDAVARGLAARWEATPFDHAEEWPIRMAAVRSRGAVTHVVVSISHVATDGGGIGVMLGELAERDPVTGEPKNPASAMGPLELAALQRTPSVRRQSDFSLRHWERLLRAAGPRRFGPHVDRGEPRYRRAVFTSRALHLASKAVAARVGSPTSSVLLAGYAVAVARLTGITPALIQVVVSNRFRPGLADVSHPLSVNGLFMVDVADASFDEVVDRTQRASASCSKYAYYDPERLDELRARIDRERGEAVEASCLFNDRRLGAETPDPLAPSPAELAAARAASALRWGDPFPRYLDKLMVQVGSAPDDAVELEVQVDTHHVSVDEVRALVLDLEGLVVAAVSDPELPTGVRAAE